MIYLILAILFSTGVFVAMRLFERFKLDNHQALMWNYVFASGTGFAICEHWDNVPQLVAEPWFGLSLLTGFWFIFTYLLMTASTQRSGVTVTSLSSIWKRFMSLTGAEVDGSRSLTTVSSSS